jgi:peptidoglycan/LPS O-acetylase OafA/YrhL
MGTKTNYLAGALVANAIVWIVSALIPKEPTDMWISFITAYFILSMIGGALGGYLVARRTQRFTPIRLGVVLGALSYAILAAVNLILGVEAWIDSAAIIGFTAGFAIGARLIELRRLKKLTTSKEMRRPKK